MNKKLLLSLIIALGVMVIFQPVSYAANLSPGLRDKHPSIPWRNILIHDYSSIQLEQVWDTIVGD